MGKLFSALLIFSFLFNYLAFAEEPVATPVVVERTVQTEAVQTVSASSGVSSESAVSQPNYDNSFPSGFGPPPGMGGQGGNYQQGYGNGGDYGPQGGYNQQGGYGEGMPPGDYGPQPGSSGGGFSNGPQIPDALMPPKKLMPPGMGDYPQNGNNMPPQGNGGYNNQQPSGFGGGYGQPSGPNGGYGPQGGMGDYGSQGGYEGGNGGYGSPGGNPGDFQRSFSSFSAPAPIMMAPIMPPDMNIEDMIMQQVGDAVFSNFDPAELKTQCSDVDGMVNKIYATISEQAGGSLVQELCSPMKDEIEKCSSRIKMCENIKDMGGGMNGPNGKMSCPPDTVSLKSNCKQRMLEDFSFQAENEKDNAALNCEREWLFNGQRFQKMCDNRKVEKERAAKQCSEEEFVKRCVGDSMRMAPQQGMQQMPQQQYNQPQERTVWMPPQGQGKQPPSGRGSCPTIAGNPTCGPGSRPVMKNDDQGCPVGYECVSDSGMMPPQIQPPNQMPPIEGPGQPPINNIDLPQGGESVPKGTEPVQYPGESIPMQEPIAQAPVPVESAPAPAPVESAPAPAPAVESSGGSASASGFSLTGLFTAYDQIQQNCKDMFQKNKAYLANQCGNGGGEQYGPFGMSESDMCGGKDVFISKCQNQQLGNMAVQYDEANLEKVCELEVKMNQRQYERFCKESARGYDDCVQNTKKGCELVQSASTKCESFATEEKIKEKLRMEAKKMCRFSTKVKFQKMDLSQIDSSETVPIIIATSESISSQEESQLKETAQIQGYTVLGGMRIYYAKIKASDFYAVKKLPFVKDVKLDSIGRALESQNMNAAPASSQHIDRSIAALEASKELLPQEYNSWVASEEDKLLSVSDGVSTVEKSDASKGIDYKVAWLLGMNAEREKKEAQQLSEQSGKLDSTIASLEKLNADIEDISVKAALQAQIEDLKKRKTEIQDLSNSKKGGAEGVFSLVKGIFGG